MPLLSHVPHEGPIQQGVQQKAAIRSCGEDNAKQGRARDGSDPVRVPMEQQEGIKWEGGIWILDGGEDVDRGILLAHNDKAVVRRDCTGQEGERTPNDEHRHHCILAARIE